MSEIVSEVPPRKVPNVPPDSEEWDTAANNAVDHPNKAILARKNVPESTLKRVRGWARRPYVSDSGRIQVVGRDSEIRDGERFYNEVYFTFVPNKRKR